MLERFRAPLVLLLAALATGCGTPPPAGPPRQEDPEVVTVAVEPRAVELAPGATQEFTATTSGGAAAGVTWAATAGTVAGSGPAVNYTAPAAAGTYRLTATAVPGGASASATITVAAAPAFSVGFAHAGGREGYGGSGGVRVVERGARPGYLVLEIEHDHPHATAHLAVESSPPAGVTFDWTSREVRLSGGGYHSEVIHIEAGPGAPLGEHALRVGVTLGGATKTAEASYEVVEGPTRVGGIIGQDTTWTAKDSPYWITSEVQVDYGATLTIEPGVEVSGGAIKTWGALRAVGSSEEPIVLIDVAIRGGTSNYGRPYDMEFQHVEFFDTPFLEPGGDYGTFAIRDSVIHSGFGHVHVWYPTSPVTIERNLFLNAPFFSIGHHQPVHLLSNTFTRGGRIENWAAYEGPTILRGNNFLDTSFRVGLKRDYPTTDLDARENYWGTTDPAVIATMITDRNDGLEYAAYIPFEPYLLAPSGEAGAP